MPVEQQTQAARRSAALGNLDEGAPLHSRVREAIRRHVRKGELIDESGRLMTEAELVKHFGVSRVTIRNAIQPLVAEGILSRERGRGTFLRSNEGEHWAGRLMGFSELLKDVGQEPGARIIGQGMTNRLDEAVLHALGERAVFELKRLRLADGAPIAIEHAFYPPDIGLELEKRDLTSIVMYRVFERELGLEIEHATQTIGATLANAEDANLLEVNVGSALISLERLTTSSQGRPLEFLRSAYLPEYFRFTVHLTRGRSGAQPPANAITRD
jgi:GntR family transcriptional regulator